MRNADSAPKEEWWRKVDPLHHISLHRPMWVGRVRSSGTACYSSAVETIAAAFVLRWYVYRPTMEPLGNGALSVGSEGEPAWGPSSPEPPR